MNYKKLFTNNVLYITGVGRSGTTILGQIIASMRPVYYLFEPSILRPPLNNDYETLRRNLFEDYFLNEICGRVNPSPMDWTYWKNHMVLSELKRRQSLYGRSDAINHIKQEKPLFVIKNPEAQHQMNELNDIFPGIRFIHILRNGLDVIGSSLQRGWFVDDYEPVDEFSKGFGFGWMSENDISDSARIVGKLVCSNGGYATIFDSGSLWSSWTPTTRAACTWRVLTEMGVECWDRGNGKKIRQIKYENFCINPYNFIDWLVPSRLKQTALTNKHLQSVKNFNHKKYDIKINDIQQPERDRFVSLMVKLGYL